MFNIWCGRGWWRTGPNIDTEWTKDLLADIEMTVFFPVPICHFLCTGNKFAQHWLHLNLWTNKMNLRGMSNFRFGFCDAGCLNGVFNSSFSFIDFLVLISFHFHFIFLFFFISFFFVFLQIDLIWSEPFSFSEFLTSLATGCQRPRSSKGQTWHKEVQKI